jgi:hypothetical protein
MVLGCIYQLCINQWVLKSVPLLGLYWVLQLVKPMERKWGQQLGQQ